MPITFNYVRELPWKATSRDHVKIKGFEYSMLTIEYWKLDSFVYIGDMQAVFSKECRDKLLAAMDNFGKAEKSADFRYVEQAAAELTDYAIPRIARCLLELHAEIEALKKK